MKKISKNAILLLKDLEGAIKHNGIHIIYDDQTGRPVPNFANPPRGATIGYGHLLTNTEKQSGKYTSGLDESGATELLKSDLYRFEDAVNKFITAKLNQNQFDALVIFAFNIGIGGFAKSSVCKHINNPDFKSDIYPDLESAWLAWNKTGGKISAGLINRRKAELKLFYSI